MSSQLTRIKTTLAQLNQKYKNSNFEDSKTSSVSKEVTQKKCSLPDTDPNISIEKEPFSSQKKSKSSLDLPAFKIKNAVSSSRHYIINSALPMNLLKDLQTMITQWQNSLTQIQTQIQQIYQEGPLLDGWLESHDHRSFSENSQPRKATEDHLMSYIEELTDHNISYQSPRHGYHLCGKDETGKIWSQPCPADQIIDVTMAIARYQKLQQLLAQKQNIETRLNRLAEGLVILHSTVQQ